MIHQILMLAKGVTKGITLCSGMSIGGFLGMKAAESLGCGKIGTLMLTVGGEIVGTSVSLNSMDIIDDTFNNLDDIFVKKREEMRKMKLRKEDADRLSHATDQSDDDTQGDVVIINDYQKGVTNYVSTKTNTVLYTKSMNKE